VEKPADGTDLRRLSPRFMTFAATQVVFRLPVNAALNLPHLLKGCGKTLALARSIDSVMLDAAQIAAGTGVDR
jgi:hypothetical protein